MKTKIELTPERVLIELAESHFACGDGYIGINAVGRTDASWINLALSTLDISFELDDYDYDDNQILWCFVIELKDFKRKCPLLYMRFKEMDELFEGFENNN